MASHTFAVLKYSRAYPKGPAGPAVAPPAWEFVAGKDLRLVLEEGSRLLRVTAHIPREVVLERHGGLGLEVTGPELPAGRGGHLEVWCKFSTSTLLASYPWGLGGPGESVLTRKFQLKLPDLDAFYSCTTILQRMMPTRVHVVDEMNFFSQRMASAIACVDVAASDLPGAPEAGGPVPGGMVGSAMPAAMSQVSGPATTPVSGPTPSEARDVSSPLCRVYQVARGAPGMMGQVYLDVAGCSNEELRELIRCILREG